MSPDRDPLDEILSSIADGKAVDWTETGRHISPEDRTRIEALNAVSRIAAFSRTLQQEGDPLAVEDNQHPEKWGDLLLLERISSGVSAELYRAWDPRLQREVALKLLAAEPGRTKETALLSEGRTAAKVRHAHVVAIHGVDVRDDRIGFWMDFLRGPTLEQEVSRSGPLTPPQAARLGQEIGSALFAVHEAGLLHRDVKPSNIQKDGEQWVLTDFGLGSSADAAAAISVPSGTPMYMAPELWTGGFPSIHSDIYALGLTLWYALAGRQPFQVDSLDALKTAILQGPPPLRDVKPEVPKELADVIERATARRPEDRFASISQFLAALDTLPSGSEPKAGVHRGWLIGGGVVTLALIAVLLVTNRPGPPPAQVVVEPMQRVLPSAAAVPTYDVEASFVKHTAQGPTRLFEGNRVKPGDRLSLETRVSHPAWVYVLNEDEHGEHYLLFPQPRFDQTNPIPPGATHVLPGTIGGRENAWTVTSRGGREYLMVVVSLKPVPELETTLAQLPKAEPGRPIEYARVGPKTLETLRGVGGLEALPKNQNSPTTTSSTSRIFDHFRALAGQEAGVQGIWIRQIELENP